MLRFHSSIATVALSTLVGACAQAPVTPPAPPKWTLAPATATLISEPALEAQIFKALDAAEQAGTDPSISKFNVRCATVVGSGESERVILGGNSEYQLPEAIHGETSLVNHVITQIGPEAALEQVRFLAFYSERCGGGGSCGDCRDYLLKTTRYRELIIACGQSSDHTVHLQHFGDGIVAEESFRGSTAAEVGINRAELQRLVEAAEGARRGGVALFTTERQHLGAAALSLSGRIYRASGADDAAFHYRYPIGGVLQQAATESDYFLKTILVVGPPGEMPRVSYRDRQYGYEFSSFNRKQGKPPIQLVLVDGPDRYRVTTFEDALPGAFSASDFMPEAVDRFLARPKQPVSKEATRSRP
jgi:cytidine deaminase